MHSSTPVLALRSVLLLDALDQAALEAAASSAADAVAIDLATPGAYGSGAEAREAAWRHAEAIAATGRPVFARVSDTRSGALADDIEAMVGEWLSAVVVAGAEAPQDARDADVAIRKHEMRSSIRPGTVRLIPEIDSATGLLAIGSILGAVDRHGGVALSIEGLRQDLQPGPRATTLYEHVMAEVAINAAAARQPWLLATRHLDAGTMAGIAHQYGAAGAIVRDEPTVRGMNALFAPDERELATARAMIDEWERLRAAGETVGVVPNDHVVDRRTVRRARALLAQHEAIERRERID